MARRKLFMPLALLASFLCNGVLAQTEFGSWESVFGSEIYVKENLPLSTVEKSVFVMDNIKQKLVSVKKVSGFNAETFLNRLTDKKFLTESFTDGKGKAYLKIYEEGDRSGGYYFSCKDASAFRYFFNFSGLEMTCEDLNERLKYWRTRDGKPLGKEEPEMYDVPAFGYSKITFLPRYSGGEVSVFVSDGKTEMLCTAEEFKTLCQTSLLSEEEWNMREKQCNDYLAQIKKEKEEQERLRQEEEERRQKEEEARQRAELSPLGLPFSFTYLLGTTVNDAPIGSALPEYASSEVGGRKRTLKLRHNLLIGSLIMPELKKNAYSKETERTAFYEAYLYGRRYYIPTKYVSISDSLFGLKLDSLENSTAEQQDKFSEYAQELSNSLFENVSKSYDSVFEKYSKSPVVVRQWSWKDTNSYSDYNKTFTFTFYNPTKKRIKYIYLTVTGYNSVEDRVGSKSLTAIGPIEPQQTASYTFDDIYMSSVMSSAGITSLKVEYMDKTTRSAAKPSTCIFSDEESDYVEAINDDFESLKYVFGD